MKKWKTRQCVTISGKVYRITKAILRHELTPCIICAKYNNVYSNCYIFNEESIGISMAECDNLMPYDCYPKPINIVKLCGNQDN